MIHAELHLTAGTLAELPGLVEQLLEFAGAERKFLLIGELGAGKTALVKAFCEKLGITSPVTSPTYALVNEYPLPTETGLGETLRHLDLYRLKNEEEALAIGIEDFLYDENYCLIEWPAVVENLLPEGVVRIEITIEPGSARRRFYIWR